MTTAEESNLNSTDSFAGPVTVHAIKTGMVHIRKNQIYGEGPGQLRRLHTFIDRPWNDWLPIYTWVIEHPEGLIVVDTGETAKSSQPGYLPKWHPYFRRGVETRVEPQEEIGPQLEDRWVAPNEVGRVVLTHFHMDHAGGLSHFPNSEILVDRSGYENALGFTGRLQGFLPNHFPEWLQPSFIDMEPTSYGPFDRSFSLTKAGDVVVVPTPGHTTGHISVIVRTPEVSYFLAGDTSYTERLMMEERVDGVAPNASIARDTLRRIKALAADEPLVYLPTHDPESAIRLSERRVVQ